MIRLDIIGNIGREPEVKGNGTDVFYVMSVGVNRSKNDTQWVDVIINQSYGSKIIDMLKKGNKIYVTGSPKVRVYVGNDKDPKCILSLNASHIEVLTKLNNPNPVINEVQF